VSIFIEKVMKYTLIIIATSKENLIESFICLGKKESYILFENFGTRSLYLVCQ